MNFWKLLGHNFHTNSAERNPTGYGTAWHIWVASIRRDLMEMIRRHEKYMMFFADVRRCHVLKPHFCLRSHSIYIYIYICASKCSIGKSTKTRLRRGFASVQLQNPSCLTFHFNPQAAYLFCISPAYSGLWLSPWIQADMYWYNCTSYIIAPFTIPDDQVLIKMRALNRTWQDLGAKNPHVWYPGRSGTMLTINPGGFPKAEKEIAVPTLVMELKEALEALKPKPKEQALEDEMWMCRMWMWMDASGLDSKIWNGHYFKLATLVFDVFFFCCCCRRLCACGLVYTVILEMAERKYITRPVLLLFRMSKKSADKPCGCFCFLHGNPSPGIERKGEGSPWHDGQPTRFHAKTCCRCISRPSQGLMEVFLCGSGWMAVISPFLFVWGGPFCLQIVVLFDFFPIFRWFRWYAEGYSYSQWYSNRSWSSSVRGLQVIQVYTHNISQRPVRCWSRPFRVQDAQAYQKALGTAKSSDELSLAVRLFDWWFKKSS